MKIAIIIRLLIFGVLLTASPALAQSTYGDAILFAWEDMLFAQSLAGRELVSTGYRYTGTQTLPPTLDGSVYDYASSPLDEPPIDGYGFYQGIWSADQTHFAFLALQPNDAGYHVIVVENGAQRLLFSDEVNQERGYLVPVGWGDDGALILLERHLLHNLQDVRLWKYSDNDATLILRRTITIPNLRGNSASFGEGIVFIGFDTAKCFIS